MRELDTAVREELDALGSGADIRHIGDTPAGPIWEAGWWWEPREDLVKGAQRALAHHLALETRHRSPQRITMLQDVIKGWRPAFAIVGRNPGTHDVLEMKRRDYNYRHSFESILDELETRALGETEDEREERITKLATELADDRTLYGILTRGRKGVLTDGLKAS